MAETKVKVETVEVNDAVERAKGFWAKFSRPIIYAGSAIILLIAGWYGYKSFIKAPKELKASEQMFAAEKLFDKMAGKSSFPKDTVSIVLNGGILEEEGKVTGLLTVIKNFGGTASGNRAQYIAGACYLHLGEFDKAIKYLKEFDGNGASQIQSKAYLLMGHAYAEQKKTSEALDYYKKAAAEVSDKDPVQKAATLYMAASYADFLNKPKEAIDILQDIKTNYMAGLVKKDPNNYQEPAPPITVREVDKLLAKLGVTQ